MSNNLLYHRFIVIPNPTRAKAVRFCNLYAVQGIRTVKEAHTFYALVVNS